MPTKVNCKRSYKACQCRYEEERAKLYGLRSMRDVCMGTRSLTNECKPRGQEGQIMVDYNLERHMDGSDVIIKSHVTCVKEEGGAEVVRICKGVGV